MFQRLRQRAGCELGFTLIELLVVMLILGILAAIAIPSFLNQKNKGSDSQAKAIARTMQTATETCATDNLGSYGACTLPTLRAIEPTIPNEPDALAAPGAFGLPYLLGARSSTGNWFYVYQEADGDVIRICAIPLATSDPGGCKVPSGQTIGTW